MLSLQAYIISLTLYWISFEFLYLSGIEWTCSSSTRCKEMYNDHIDGKSSDVLNHCERDPECQAYQYYKVGSLFYGVLCHTSNLVVELEYPGFYVCIKPEGRRPMVVTIKRERRTRSKSNSIQQNISKTMYLFTLIILRWCVNILGCPFRIHF